MLELVGGAHVHGPGAAAWTVDVALIVPFLVAAAAYVCAMRVADRRGRCWPRYRALPWVLGLAAAALGFVGPLARLGHSSFTAHMAAHLFVGMVAPLLLALALPLTLALRTMAVAPARRLSRMLRSLPVRILTHPLVAALINVGGLWALYLTPVYELMQQAVLVHWLVMVHFLVAGYICTVSLVPMGPSPHRASFTVRSVALVLSLAAHAVLAKILYAYPPAGVTAADARAGSQLMYYGGDVVEFAIMLLLWVQWYRATGRGLRDTGVPRVGATPRSSP